MRISRSLGRGERRGQLRLPHQVLVDRAGGAPALGNRPDDERLAALHVAGGEDTADVRHPARVAADVAAIGQRHAKIREQPALLGPVNPIASSTRSARISNSLPGHRRTCMRPSARVTSTFTACSARTRPFVPDEPLRGDGVEPLASLLVRRRDAEDVRPLGPGIVRRRGFRAVSASARAGAPTAPPADARSRGSRRPCRRRR
jgi:hypothetical protein